MEEDFGGGEQNLEEVLRCQYKSGTNVTKAQKKLMAATLYKVAGNLSEDDPGSPLEPPSPAPTPTTPGPTPTPNPDPETPPEPPEPKPHPPEPNPDPIRVSPPNTPPPAPGEPAAPLPTTPPILPSPLRKEASMFLRASI